MNSLDTYMQGHLAAVQNKEFRILCAIRDICERNNIDYWLDGGTCLGAVRHGGFIPWDDDIDIAMRREDMPRFAEAAKKELPDGLFLQTNETDPTYTHPMIKVRDMNSLLVEFSDDFTRPYQKGLFVDIFPMHSHPSLTRKQLHYITKGYCRSTAILNAQHKYSWRSIAELFWFGAKHYWFYFLWKSANLFLKTNEFFGNAIEDNGYGITHSYNNVFPTKPIMFNGETFRGPANPDAYLKDLYGDYMQLPPEDKRKGHAAFYIENLI